jgi:hypothetical protein
MIMPLSVFGGLILGIIISVIMAFNNLNEYKPVFVEKTRSRGSIKLVEGFDTRLQYTMPAWAYNLQAFEGVVIK